MLNYDDVAENALKGGKNRRKSLLTEKRMCDILLYCVSMDEMPLPAVYGGEKVGLPGF